MIYGPNTPAVQSILDRFKTLTTNEINLLEEIYGESRYAAWLAAQDRICGAIYGAAREVARNDAQDAIGSAAKPAAWAAANDNARHAAWGATDDAILATLTYDLAGEKRLYTIAHRDLLLGPWVEVCGMPAALHKEN